LFTGVDALALAAQPFAVEKVRAGELGPEPGTAQPVDRLAIEVASGRPVAEQRLATSLDAKRPVGPSGLGGLRQPRERSARELGVTCARGRLHELWQRPHGDPRLERVRGGSLS